MEQWSLQRNTSTRVQPNKSSFCHKLWHTFAKNWLYSRCRSSRSLLRLSS